MSVWPALSLGVAALFALSGWIRRDRWLEAGAVAVGVLGGMTWWPLSLAWAWSHQGLAVLVWIVMAVREHRSWVRGGGGFRNWFADLREDRSAQDGLLGWFLLLLSQTLFARGDPISAAVVLVVAFILIRRGQGDRTIPEDRQSFDWHVFGQQLALVLLGFALFALFALLAFMWVLWVDLQTWKLSL